VVTVAPRMVAASMEGVDWVKGTSGVAIPEL